MAKVIDQSIPSEILDQYTKLLLPAKADGHVGGTVEKRPPFTQPTWRGFIVDLPTIHQVFVRECFKRATICFACQPQTGGVEPPAIGPRSREWWYTDCGEYDIDYYRYFMHMTIPPYLDGWTPDWCKSPNKIGYKEIVEGENRNEPKQYWGDTWEEAWGLAVEGWNASTWYKDSGHSTIWFRGLKNWTYTKRYATIGALKTVLKYDLENLPGGDNWEKVEDAWFEITPSPDAWREYAGALSIVPGGSHSWQPYFEIFCSIGNFGNANAEFLFKPASENGAELEPTNPPKDEYRIKGGAVNINNIKIGYLLSE